MSNGVRSPPPPPPWLSLLIHCPHEGLELRRTPMEESGSIAFLVSSSWAERL